jgi:hypothetical protein
MRYRPKDSNYKLRRLLRQQVQSRVTIPDYFGKPWGWEKAKEQVLNILRKATTHPILDELHKKGRSRQEAIDELIHLPEPSLTNTQSK